MEKLRPISSRTSLAALFSLASVLKFITTCVIYTQYMRSIYRSQGVLLPSQLPYNIGMYLFYTLLAVYIQKSILFVHIKILYCRIRIFIKPVKSFFYFFLTLVICSPAEKKALLRPFPRNIQINYNGFASIKLQSSGKSGGFRKRAANTVKKCVLCAFEISDKNMRPNMHSQKVRLALAFFIYFIC